MNEEKGRDWSRIINQWGAVASIIGLVFTFFSLREGERRGAFLNTAFVLFGSAIVAFAWVTAKHISHTIRKERKKAAAVARELAGFRDSASDIHSVMHLLRDGLLEVADAPLPLTKKTLVLIQAGTVSKVVSLIARIFSSLSNCDVNACVSLCEGRENGGITCFGWCHSRNGYVFTEGVEDLSVDSLNTRFECAARPNSDGLSYFFSGNLIALDASYRDQCRRWAERYKSCLVVPIRTDSDSSSLIGFLKLETLEIDKLNDSYHRELLSAFADGICMYLHTGASLTSKTVDDKGVEGNESDKVAF